MNDEKIVEVNGYTVILHNVPTPEEMKKKIKEINKIFEEKYGRVKDPES